MDKNMSVEEAARILNKPPQFVRLALQQERVDFGFAVHNKRWSYHISRKKLEEYIGEEYTEKEEVREAVIQ